MLLTSETDRIQTADGHEGCAPFVFSSEDLSAYQERVNSATAGSDVPSSSLMACYTGLAASTGRSYGGEEVEASAPVEPLLDESGASASQSQGRASVGRTEDSVEETDGG